MKLPETKLTLEASLLEFDVWIRATLGEIRDTDKFQEQMARVVEIFDALETATKGFASVDDCQPASIAETIVSILQFRTGAETSEFLQALSSVLFLVTGKSDNNAKCQLPIYLRDNAKWASLPIVRRGAAVSVKIPRELKADKFMGIVAGLKDYKPLQTKLLDVFARFILSDKSYVSQLWSIGKSYAMLKALGHERDLLSPLVVFQIRGSVAASGGHEPEQILRATLMDWGMEPDVDFNLSDAVISKDTDEIKPVEGEEAAVVRVKTRAYDFVLPFRTEGWKPRIFVQCQFYAGDSGSVSHKNVDQTCTSRVSVLSVVPSAIFVEYVDGAGYFSSLNGDLNTLLSMATTKSFFQVRSASIRLRRELQAIGFLLPIELEHAILRSDGIRERVVDLLQGEGYSPNEISRTLNRCLERGLVGTNGSGLLDVDANRRAMVRRYLLLDTIARNGNSIELTAEKIAGFLLVPGYGAFFGMKMDEAIAMSLEACPQIKADWSNPEVPFGDIRWLCEAGLAMSS